MRFKRKDNGCHFKPMQLVERDFFGPKIMWSNTYKVILSQRIQTCANNRATINKASGNSVDVLLLRQP